MTTTTDVAAGAMRKAMLRVGPFLGLLYLIAYIDRNNAGFAKLEMTTGLGITESAFGLAAGIFFIGYLIFEVPSNLMLQRFGARKWIARIMISWGNQNVMYSSTPGKKPASATPRMKRAIVNWVASVTNAVSTATMPAAVPHQGPGDLRGLQPPGQSRQRARLRLDHGPARPVGP